MTQTNDEAITSLFEFSDVENEFINEFLQMFYDITRKLDDLRGKPSYGVTPIPQIEFILLRGAVKALCLFWLDYHAYRTCEDETDLEGKRAAIRELMEQYCKEHPKSVRDMGMMTMFYMELSQYYLDNTKNGADLDDDADLESCAFFLALAKKGLFLREQYVDVQKLSRKFIRTRREEMFSLIKSCEARAE
jgi:hypothetical protein